jgi:hypothetical protein
MTHTTTTTARRAPAGAGRQFPLWCKGGGKDRRWNPEEAAKGFPLHATRPRPPGLQDGGHHRAHHDARIRLFAGEDHLSSG